MAEHSIMFPMQAGGPKDVQLTERLRSAGEALIGGTVFSVSLWGPMLDHLMVGLHFVAAFTGAFVGCHGVYRIFNPKARQQ